VQGSLVHLIERTVHQTREVAFDDEILSDEKNAAFSKWSPTFKGNPTPECYHGIAGFSEGVGTT